MKIINFFLGQQSANAIGGVLTSNDEESADNGKSEEPASLSADIVILAFLRDAGFLYFWEGEKTWNIFIARTMSSTVKIIDVVENGCHLSFDSKGPTDFELLTSNLLKDHIQELHFMKSEASIFVESPRPLSQDHSNIKEEFFPPNRQRWLLYSILWKEQEKQHTVEFAPFYLNKFFLFFLVSSFHRSLSFSRNPIPSKSGQGFVV